MGSMFVFAHLLDFFLLIQRMNGHYVKMDIRKALSPDIKRKGYPIGASAMFSGVDEKYQEENFIKHLRCFRLVVK